MEKENITKPANLKNPQAHHDFPQKFRDKFLAAGIDIDDPQYGRWVEGSPEGNHQRWTREYNDIWENFFKDNKDIPPKELKELIKAKRQELIKDPRFQ
jgi:hypothetical protein